MLRYNSNSKLMIVFVGGVNTKIQSVHFVNVIAAIVSPKYKQHMSNEGRSVCQARKRIAYLQSTPRTGLCQQGGEK